MQSDLKRPPEQPAGGDSTPRPDFELRVVPSAINAVSWKLKPVTVFALRKDGFDGEKKTYVYHLYDEFDAASGTSSMARTTGYTCTSIVRAVAAGLFREVGLYAPEALGRADGCFRFVLDRLAERGVVFQESEEEI